MKTPDGGTSTYIWWPACAFDNAKIADLIAERRGSGIGKLVQFIPIHAVKGTSNLSQYLAMVCLNGLNGLRDTALGIGKNNPYPVVGKVSDPLRLISGPIGVSAASELKKALTIFVNKKSGEPLRILLFMLGLLLQLRSKVPTAALV